jgi:hypothetical protein
MEGHTGVNVAASHKRDGKTHTILRNQNLLLPDSYGELTLEFFGVIEELAFHFGLEHHVLSVSEDVGEVRTSLQT